MSSNVEGTNNNDKVKTIQGSEPPFDSCSEIKTELFLAQIQLSKFAGRYLTIVKVLDHNGDDLVLIYPDSKALPAEEANESLTIIILPVSLSPPQGPKFFRGSSDNPGNNRTTIPRDTPSSVANICNYIVWFVTIKVGIPIDNDAIYATVLNAFTNLQWATEKGFASFYSKTTGSNSAYEYRVTFSAPLAGDKNSFLSFVSTIRLQADIRTQKGSNPNAGNLYEANRKNATKDTLETCYETARDPQLSDFEA
ncbi:hypothetical protein VNI00_009259 [Paramarasmius palmivorus]|uniref:Uncharacterized protein n=1 Tax=Paramarasmius palmivorus TaxID=297713 RepID=A0AAW0CPB6_9AGAR